MWKPYKSDYIQSFLHVPIKHVQEKKNLIVKEKENYFTLTSFQLQHWKNKDIDYLCQLYLLSLQGKLLAVDFLYSRHLSTTNFFLRDGWNGTQTLKMKPQCSGHFIANRSIQWTSNHITPYNWHRHILYIACSGPRKCRDFQSVFISMVNMFSSCKDVQSVMDRDRNIDTLIKISVAHGQPLLLYKEN